MRYVYTKRIKQTTIIECVWKPARLICVSSFLVYVWQDNIFSERLKTNRSKQWEPEPTRIEQFFVAHVLSYMRSFLNVNIHDDHTQQILAEPKRADTECCWFFSQTKQDTSNIFEKQRLQPLHLLNTLSRAPPRPRRDDVGQPLHDVPIYTDRFQTPN